ncbi:unnamed protein product [Didymodactylos carnosus]|uniref:Uncharacterized protein n=1 Tax=Didymodactylos carnosus TaxID=1234261 RepID=A0A816A0G6_9BILA|nr:unnamed protein product [Didymodactylos carnosus]CAF1591101.1 unnamed protein product [Didymodactylos carnosus]CAF4338128.1 unnamed protein product [Didymodactylos carnosus]CAF4463267.1 unnamed protein product [Didymodactylos carnosus]
MLSDLRHFYSSITSLGTDKILAALPKSTLQTLSMKLIELNLALSDQFISVINLSISYCSIQKLCQFFRYVPKLKYLNVQHFHQFDDLELKEKVVNLTNEYIAIHLKHLIIHDFMGSFDSLEILLKKIPNLKSLTISAYSDNEEDIIDACRWQHLITSSLPFLDVFKFMFSVLFLSEIYDIGNRLLPFQSDFWHQQHHWYIECAFSNERILIYTTPYLSNEYFLQSYTKIYCNTSNTTIDP